MKHLHFRELLLLSEVEKSARRISIDPKTTVIVGRNDTGKSCLVKSLYETFGARAAKTHPTWNKAMAWSLVRYTLDGHDQSILRHGDIYGVFGQDGELLANFDSVTKGLGPYLAEELEFELRLRDRNGASIAPPPQYLFLPYYVDQDAGWGQAWSSFDRLAQLPNWKAPLAEYHTGIRPNEYYRVLTELETKKQALAEAQAEYDLLSKSRRIVSAKLPQHVLPVDFDDFEAEISRLTNLVRHLKVEEEGRLSKLLQFENQRAIAREQLTAAENAYKEIRSDYDYAVTKVHESVECPTCGATYENSFAERFGLADDAERCLEIIALLRKQVNEFDEKIVAARQIHDSARKQYDEIRSVLHEKKETVALEDLIKSKGRAEVERVFRDSLEPVEEDMGKLQGAIASLTGRLKELDNKERKEEIQGFYHEWMRRSLHKLDVRTLPEEAYRRVSSTISETGSDQPRALLAQYFSILHTIAKFGSSVFCPIVIDSPNQQAQDSESLHRMLSFIRESVPEGAQLILAAEDLHGVAFDGTAVSLDTKLHLLRKEEYSRAREEMEPFLDAIHLR